ncbi:MAG: hypothetical protein KY476_10485 [Planctomycetes bacterium]|nr:hypothetical protein [Planctomycetota bacterium]
MPARLLLASVGTFLLCAVLHAADPAANENAYRFESGAQTWQVYDYNGGKAGGTSVFHPATWERTGGVEDSGYVWGDDSRWRIDTPEKPHSVLAFFTRRSYARQKPIDLRGAKVSVHLRGEKLDLKGGKCLFWVFSDELGTRWHLRAVPLEVPDGKWSDKQSFVLEEDEDRWHRSWARYPDKPGSLGDVLRTCDSYGLSFVGFDEEPTGRFAMDELIIEPQAK